MHLPFIYTILSKNLINLIKSVNFSYASSAAMPALQLCQLCSYASSAHPAHLHTCRKPVQFQSNDANPVGKQA